MTRFLYRTATSLDGFIADPENSLAWLFAVADDPEQMTRHAAFMERIGVIVEGSTTYEWVLEAEQILDHPEKWQEYFASRPTFVFTTRRLPVPAGADVRFVSGEVAAALPAITAAASGRDVWLCGGGDLVGQFDAAGALDEVQVSIAPVTLGAGAPLLARRIESDRLVLREAAAEGQFVAARYEVARTA